MTTTTGAAPMSAAEVLSRIDNLINHAESSCPKWSTLAIKVKAAKKARNAVAAMAEREAETSRALTVSLNVVKRLQAERDALVKEVEALRADAERLDWFDKNGFTAYRQIDPIDGISSHCVVVHETQKPRRGNVADGIRAAIDAARADTSHD